MNPRPVSFLLPWVCDAEFFAALAPSSSTTSARGTQMDRRQTGPRVRKIAAQKSDDSQALQDKRESGWIWQLGRLTKMTDVEMDEWSREGDRVQWFRAEAEMLRWREQKEQKIAELL
ncbi:hypothetical protein C8F01DRAFT_670999 [Mycena amicta]|nr:hypothetical protein C8F01DRAFT_670999 [Mycena amicta]